VGGIDLHVKTAWALHRGGRKGLNGRAVGPWLGGGTGGEGWQTKNLKED